jgi:hypothetical protein
MTAVASPLMAFLDRAMRLDRPSLISIEGHGSISVYPHQRTYTTDIRDWAAVPFSELAGIRAAAVVWSTPPAESMPVSELRWLAALHQARCVVGAKPLARGLVKLRHWPDVSALPESLAAPIVRICALLWRKPTASFLMPRILEISSDETDALLWVLQAFGHVEIASQLADRTEEGALAEGAGDTGTHDGASGSVIAKLWRRLLVR